MSFSHGRRLVQDWRSIKKLNTRSGSNPGAAFPVNLNCPQARLAASCDHGCTSTGTLSHPPTHRLLAPPPIALAKRCTAIMSKADSVFATPASGLPISCSVRSLLVSFRFEIYSVSQTRLKSPGSIYILFARLLSFGLNPCSLHCLNSPIGARSDPPVSSLCPRLPPVSSLCPQLQARLRAPLELDAGALVGADRATKDDRRVLLGLDARDSFDFDHVFGTDATHANIFYQGEMERWVRALAQGYNGALLVLGEVWRIRAGVVFVIIELRS